MEIISQNFLPHCSLVTWSSNRLVPNRSNILLSSSGIKKSRFVIRNGTSDGYVVGENEDLGSLARRGDSKSKLLIPGLPDQSNGEASAARITPSQCEWKPNLTVHYEKSGCENVEAPAVLFLPGFGVGSFHYEKQLTDLGRDYRVWAVDFVGQGLSLPTQDPTTTTMSEETSSLEDSESFWGFGNEAQPWADQLVYSLDLWREQVQYIVEEVIGEPVYIAGNSLGGYVALYFAATHPHLVKGVTLLNATPFWGFFPNPVRSPRLARLFPWSGTFPLPARVKKLTELVWQKISDPESIAEILKQVYKDHSTDVDKVFSRIVEITQHPAAAASFASIMFAPGGELSFSEALSRCKENNVQICLMYGREDPWVGPIWGKKIKKELPNAPYYKNSSSSFSVFIFTAVIILRCLNPIKAATCHPDDEAGLLAFKSGITRDPSGILSSWKKGTACCSWNGITCLTGDRVTALTVSGQSEVAGSFLSGTISSSLAKLQHLDGIYLMNLKNITGPFPQFLFRLPQLKYVYIENNRLSGPLPVNIGSLSQIEAFSLEGNRFTGPIPTSISNLTKLSQLNLGGNLLTGTIPSGVANLKLISFLNLGGNRLSGTIPDIFKSMPELRSLVLSRNGFSGNLPPSIPSLAPILRFLEVGRNKLSGKIPEYLSRFKALDTLDLSRNKFSGAVPKSFANLTKIFNLDLSHNLLTDPFPALYVKGIESLDLSYNKFHLKTIPKWVTSSPIIFSLKLAKCGIKMSLDDWKPAEYYFYDFIDLSENEISGSPARFLNQTEYLVEFRAAGNKLRFDMGKLTFAKTLKTLDLSRNLVFGKVPATVAGLQTLNVSQNHLCGKLPTTKFPASAFAGNDCLCGPPLFPCKV